MQILIVADTFIPSRISAAIQLYDLSTEMARQGHRVTVLVPSVGRSSAWTLEEVDGVRVLRVRALRIKDVGLIRRALAEMYLPLALLRGLQRSGLDSERWNGLVWYSPSIFLGLVAKRAKQRSGCKAYLVVRDLFPDWAVDAGVMRKGLAYRFFKKVERFQYRVADVIGVQTAANCPLVARDSPPGANIEVLHNWYSLHPGFASDELTVDVSSFAGRTIFVYPGNMGVAQDLDIFVDLAARMSGRNDLAFLFVGRGSEFERLQLRAGRFKLTNIRFVGEIDPTQIPLLLSRCHVGIVALNPHHTTHNIPGKFVTYMRYGLPVLARINTGNDLDDMITQAHVGIVAEDDTLDALERAVLALVNDPAGRVAMSIAGRELSERLFTTTAAVTQITSAFA